MGDILKLLAVASEENGTGPRPVANADNIALQEGWTVRSRNKWLVVSAVAGRLVGNRGFMEAWAKSVRCQIIQLVRNIPGMRKSGYGLVDRPTPIIVDSGLSYILASQ